MKIIMNVEIRQGYEKWKELFNSAGDARAKYGVKVLAYGHPKDNENKVYQVLEIESMEKMQEAMQDPEIAKARTDAGVDINTQKIVFFVASIKNSLVLILKSL